MSNSRQGSEESIRQDQPHRLQTLEQIQRFVQENIMDIDEYPHENENNQIQQSSEPMENILHNYLQEALNWRMEDHQNHVEPGNPEDDPNQTKKKIAQPRKPMNAYKFYELELKSRKMRDDIKQLQDQEEQENQQKENLKLQGNQQQQRVKKAPPVPHYSSSINPEADSKWKDLSKKNKKKYKSIQNKLLTKYNAVLETYNRLTNNKKVYSPYILFFKKMYMKYEIQSGLTLEDLDNKEISKKIGRDWKNLSFHQKSEYIKQYEEEKQRSQANAFQNYSQEDYRRYKLKLKEYIKEITAEKLKIQRQNQVASFTIQGYEKIHQKKYILKQKQLAKRRQQAAKKRQKEKMQQQKIKSINQQKIKKINQEELRVLKESKYTPSVQKQDQTGQLIKFTPKKVNLVEKSESKNENTLMKTAGSSVSSARQLVKTKEIKKKQIKKKEIKKKKQIEIQQQEDSLSYEICLK